MTRSVALLLLAAGCTPGQVAVIGVVTDGPDDKTRPLAGVTLELRDEDGVLFDQTTTGSDGSFRVGAPAGETIFAVVSGDGLIPASFTGVSGFDPKLFVTSGLLYGFREGLYDDWEEDYRGCGNVAGGGAILGEVRNIDLIDDETGEHPLIVTAFVATEDGPVEGCYLDDAGAAYDPDAEVTGNTGRFLVPEVGEGLHVLLVQYEIADGATTSPVRYGVWMPPGGVAPRFPAWVETPGL